MATTVEKSRVLVVDDGAQITRVLRTVLNSQSAGSHRGGGRRRCRGFAEFRPELGSPICIPHMDGVSCASESVRSLTVPIIDAVGEGVEERTRWRRSIRAPTTTSRSRSGIDELLARVRAALRRSGGESGDGVVRCRRVQVDLRADA